MTLKILPVAVSLFLVMCSQANATPPDTVANDHIYLQTGGGVHFLDLPESSPFVRTNGKEEIVGFLEHYDAEFKSGPRIEMIAGYNYQAAGKNLYTELSGFSTSYRSSHTHVYRGDVAAWADVRAQFETQYCQQGTEFGACITPETEQHLVALIKNDPHIRSVGWIGKIDGGSISFGAPNFAWGDPIRIKTKRKVDFYGLGLVTGVVFAQTERSRTSFYIGPSFKRLDQESDIFAYESNREPQVNNVTLKEDLEASYYGATLGSRIEVPLRQHWHLMLDGKLGLYYLDSEYRGLQRTLLSSARPVLDEQTDWDDDSSEVAATLGVETSLSIALSENMNLRVAAGADYLSHAPVIRYARHGEGLASGQTHSAAHIVYSDALGHFITISIGIKL